MQKHLINTSCIERVYLCVTTARNMHIFYEPEDVEGVKTWKKSYLMMIDSNMVIDLLALQFIIM